ncbi:thioredoxin [Bacillus pseudomycoides]|nr:thioredoxin [Bacillus pseudomycoides]
MIAFYDSWCPMCTKIANRTKELDKKGKITFVSFREEEIVQQYCLSEEMQQNMEQHLYIYKDARWYKGIQSIYVLAKVIPAYWAIVPFIKLSILFGFGHVLYDYIATKREIVPVGHCKNGVCEIRREK